MGPPRLAVVNMCLSDSACHHVSRFEMPIRMSSRCGVVSFRREVVFSPNFVTANHSTWAGCVGGNENGSGPTTQVNLYYRSVDRGSRIVGILILSRRRIERRGLYSPFSKSLGSWQSRGSDPGVRLFFERNFH